MMQSSARQMIFDAYQTTRGGSMEDAALRARLGTAVQCSVKLNHDWRIVDGLEKGQVMAAVESLPEHLQAFARYTWGPDTEEDRDTLREVAMEGLYLSYLQAGGKVPGQGQRLPSAAALDSLRWLCSAAVFHYGEVTYPFCRDGLSTPRKVKAWLYAWHGVEINVHDWTRRDRVTWGAVWERLLQILSDWEPQALGPVARLIPRKKPLDQAN